MKFSCHRSSEALKDSLIDVGVVDKVTRKPIQDYFELDIKEGPILGLSQKVYDMEGTFHVGCSEDVRAPSFYCGVYSGDSQTKKGMTYIEYERTMRYSVFKDNNAFRKGSSVVGYSVRDLDAVSKSFGERENFNEKLGVYWSGWSGKYGPAFFTGERSKQFFSDRVIELAFEGELCTSFRGFDNVLGNSKDEFNVPFHRLSKNTALETAAKIDRDKSLGRGLMHYEMEDAGVKLEQLVTGIFQVAERTLPARITTTELKQEIIKACAEFKMAPKNYVLRD